MQVSLTEYRLRLGRDLQPHETPRLRGFFGREFADHILLHHHLPDGRLLYAYPRIQFKVIGHTALLVGIAEGSDLLARLWLRIDRARLGTEVLPVLEAHLVSRLVEIGETAAPIEYRFLSPWLALNQENERRYRELQDERARVDLLNAVLVGNCLSFAKSLGYRVKERLLADCSRLREVRCHLKGIPMRGFVGRFSVNFQLPDHIGIGKSVSRGFGTIEQVASQGEQGGRG